MEQPVTRYFHAQKMRVAASNSRNTILYHSTAVGRLPPADDNDL
jgi:hypothetical protein